MIIEDAFSELRNSIHALRQLSYAVQLIEQITEVQTPIPEIYAVFAELIAAESSSGPNAEQLIRFELHLLAALGLSPDLTRSAMSDECRRTVADWITCPLASVPSMTAASCHFQGINQWLHGYLIYHLGKYPRSRTAALGD